MDKQRADRDLSVYDSMSTEELLGILEQDENRDPEEADAETIFRIMKILEERGAVAPGRGAREAWEEFKTDYLPYAGLHPLRRSEAREKKAAGREPVRRSHSGPQRHLRIAAAVLVALFAVGSFTAYAKGGNLWGRVARWANGVFRFEYAETVPEPVETAVPEIPETGYNSLQEALDAGGITEKLAPTWIPEGYVLSSVNVHSDKARSGYDAIYRKGEQTLVICISECYQPVGSGFEMDEEGSVTEYEKNGITHYLITNSGQQNAVWATGQYECAITGALEEQELIQMIDSIYER